MRWILVFVLVLAGCGNEEPEEVHEERAEAHVHEAPHGGALHEIGDHFANVELLFDSRQGKLTLFVLGSHAETAVRIKQKSLAVEVEIPEKVQSENIQMALFGLVFARMNYPSLGCKSWSVPRANLRPLISKYSIFSLVGR